MYTLYSSKDIEKFEVTDKVVEASALLKNLCEITDVNQGITVDCSSDTLSLYLKLIDHYETVIHDIHDRNFEKALFKKITKKQFGKMAKELCYLDCDFFIDAVADEILDRIKKKDVKGITTYFGLKDDFSSEERKNINDNLLDYIVFGRNYPDCPHFTLIPNSFYSTFNVLLTRIVKRSQGHTSLKLSLINKTLKVESDRFPIKLSNITIIDKWYLTIDSDHFRFRRLEVKEESHFNAIKKRGIVTDSMEVALTKSYEKTWIQENMNLNFIYPSNKKAFLEVDFLDSTLIKYFTPNECHFTTIEYRFANTCYDLDLVYSLLVEKSVSQEIELSGNFEFWPDEVFRVFKHENSVKFHECFLGLVAYGLPSNFKEFILKYMTDDGIIKAYKEIFNCQKIYDGHMYIYSVCDIINQL